MENYHFETSWRIEAPIEQLWQEIDQVDAWHEWAPEIKRSFIEGPEGHLQPGSIVNCELYTPLPYHVRVHLEATEVDAPHKLAFHATGDLEGNGRWQLEEDGDETVVRYEWNLHPTGPVLNALSKVSLVRRMAEGVHENLAAHAFEGLQDRISA